MKILITGGAGFIGSAVIRNIISTTNDSVINVDKLTYSGNLDSLKDVESCKRYAFEKIDICDGSKVKEVFFKHQPDAVMHLAAESHVDRSINSPDEFIKTNIIGTFTLLEVARKYWASLPDQEKKLFRFHHVSTDEVYGDLATTNDFFTEKTPYQPSSPYSASKASSDHLVRAWNRTFGFPTLVSNCSNNYGPYQYPEKLIPVTIINALEGNDIPVYGNGKQIRDWLYVDDHARALYLVLMKGTIGSTYNIGGHNEVTNIEMINEVCSVLDEKISVNKDLYDNYKIPFASLIKHVQDRLGHDFRYAIDAGKIREELGWVPMENFRSGVRKTVDWYLENSSWWGGKGIRVPSLKDPKVKKDQLI